MTTLNERAAAPPRRSHRRPIRARTGHILVPVVGGTAAVIALWWHDTPSITAVGDWLTNAGRVIGLLAGFSAVVLVVLMARIPALERGVGSDRLARWHAMGGRYMVGLVVVHPLLITWGYAITAHAGVVGQAKSLVFSYPDVLPATIGTLLLLGVGIVSARAARRRLPYEIWHYLHFTTYLAIALAFNHQLSTGADFVKDRPASLLWTALYVVAGGLLLLYRFALPLRRAFRHRMRVHSVRMEAPGTLSVWIQGRHLEGWRAEPGQFFRWRFLTRDLWWAANPYSLSAPARPDLLRITVKISGAQSAALARLRPGTRVFAEGPYGAFTAGRLRGRKVLLLAGGVGITPIRALFETLPARPGDLTLIYRATDWTGVVFRDELLGIAKARHAALHFLVGSRHELGGDPLSPASLTRILPDLRAHDVYVCGPDGMASAATKSLREAGVPRGRIHHESFEF